MQFPHSRILIFAKAPEAGRVKTRLIPALGGDGAALLQQRLLDHTLDWVTQAALCPVELWCAPDDRHPAFRSLAACHGITLRAQQGADLGQRMAHAARSALADAQQVLLIGNDCPVMKADYLRAALQALQQGKEVVFGPAEDGGYVLLGLRRCHDVLFSDLPWGSERVMAVSRRRVAELGLPTEELAVLWDLDRPEDWQRLCRERPDLQARLVSSEGMLDRT